MKRKSAKPKEPETVKAVDWDKRKAEIKAELERIDREMEAHCAKPEKLEHLHD